VALDDGDERQAAARFDLRHQLNAALQVEVGGDVDHLREARRRQRPVTETTYRVVNDYADEATRVGAYGMASWSASPSLTISPGIRTDHWTLTAATTASPWLQVECRLSATTTIRGATGVYQQFPTFEEVVGAWGRAGLQPERATHVDLGLQQSIGRAARVQVTIYDREERDFVRRPGAETRVIDGRLVRGSSAARYDNRLDGHARGIEVLVQRLDSNGFSGWASYAYGRNRYHDATSGEAFWGDLDQRHTVNLFALYRLSPRTSLSAKLRTGSNFPAPGYYEERDGRYYISETRNDLRLPSFARLDLRANRTFTWSTRRLTIFAEVINVLNKENVRYHPPSVDGRTFEARRLFESLLPIVPSAGVLVEF
jgi:TonB dependent receptor